MRFVQRKGAVPLPLGDLPDWFSALLRARGVDTPEAAEAFLHPSPEDLHDPFLLEGMAETVRLLRKAAGDGDPVLIWGDYDADGVCAASILLETLRETGVRADVFIPSRHRDGYGLNADRLRELAGRYRLLITVDCGISAVAETALARKLGLTVVLTDHHEPPEVLPAADAVMDPLLGSYPFPRLCGAGVALKITQALQGMEGVRKRLDLAAIATVADIVPLTGENRIIVREGLKALAETDRPGLRALMKLAGIQGQPRSEDLAFRIGPRINAAGRMGDADPALRLLTTRDEAEGGALARGMEENNLRRQEEERGILDAARKQIAGEAGDPASRILIAQGENWNPGLIGLAAGKICQQYHRPAIVLTLRDGQAVGSCRSVPGVHLYRLLSRCEDLLIRYGGHEQAAGITIDPALLPAFRDRMNRLIRESCGEDLFIPETEYDLALPFRSWTPDRLSRLEELEPTGCGNSPPAFLLANASPQVLRRVGRDGAHLKLRLADPEGTVIDGIAFGQGEEADRLRSRVDAVYHPVRNDFGGRVRIEAQAEALRDACPDPGLLALESREDGLRLLRERCLTDEELRRIYRLLRARSFASRQELAEATGFSPARIDTALTAFRDTRLIRVEEHPFSVTLLPPVPCRMSDSPLIRYLRSVLRISDEAGS